MRSTIFAAFILFSLAVSAQLTRRETAVYNTIEGDTLFVLNDSTKVNLSDIEDSWYKTKAVVLIERKYWNESDSNIAAGAVIYDKDKQIIGSVKSGFKASESRIEEVRKYRKHVWVSIEGYIYNRNIHYKSIPEKGLEKIINAKSRVGQYDNLLAYFETYNFKKIETSNFTYWFYIDENASIEDEKPYRVGVIFRGESSLYCVVTNERPFELVKLKIKKENGAGVYYFTSKPTSQVFEEITDQVYSFIPL